MKFWIFIFSMNLVIPLSMIIFGKYFTKHKPESINGVFGYRTPMSMKNKETWEFAHNYFGRIWFYMGVILLIISVLGMLFLIEKNESIIENYSVILNIIQIIFLIIPIAPTELALRKNFDRQGNRKIQN